MKRSEAVKKLINLVYIAIYSDLVIMEEEEADRLLGLIEQELGMNPPLLNNDKCQAIMRTYTDGNFNQWDEDFEKDEKLMEAYRLRMEKKK